MTFGKQSNGRRIEVQSYSSDRRITTELSADPITTCHFRPDAVGIRLICSAHPVNPSRQLSFIADARPFVLVGDAHVIDIIDRPRCRRPLPRRVFTLHYTGYVTLQRHPGDAVVHSAGTVTSLRLIDHPRLPVAQTTSSSRSRSCTNDPIQPFAETEKDLFGK